MKTDLELQRDVMEELKWNPFLKASEIGVSVRDGVVTLSGYVDSYGKKRAAEKAAMKVEGVRAIAEDILVNIQPDYERSDLDIAGAIVDALKWNSAFENNQIRVKVEDGWVFLEGEVDWEFQRNEAKRVVENLIGVKGISNLISIIPKLNIGDVKKEITSAFYRRAIVDANNIDVESNNGKVILRGTVRSYAEKIDAEQAAWNAEGVVAIENELEVNVPAMISNEI